MRFVSQHKRLQELTAELVNIDKVKENIIGAIDQQTRILSPLKVELLRHWHERYQVVLKEMRELNALGSL